MSRFPSPLVHADWLAGHVGSVVIADVRFYLDGRSTRDAYDDGHIPGAVYVDLGRDLAGPPSAVDGRHPLPGPERFAVALGRLGIGEDDAVVAYDDAGGSIASRLWWMLRAIGQPCAVLDGGIAAWSGALSTEPVVVEPVVRAPRPWPPERFRDADQVARSSEVGSAVILDARPPHRYEGDPAIDPAIDPRPGHVPGARNAPWAENLDARTGRFSSRIELRERFELLGVGDGDAVVAYCGSGVTACHNLLALELAGLAPAALFTGSWSAWASDPSRPVEAGTGAPVGS